MFKAGLSIDEIWSYQDESKIVDEQETIPIESITADGNVSSNNVCGENEEEAIIFNSGEGGEDNIFQDADEAAAAAEICSEGGSAPKTDASLAALSEGSPGNSGFELVDDSLNGDVSGDPVLDELEAEIARELED